MNNSVAVIGAGAVGTFYGAKLQKGGARVQYYSRFLYENLKSDSIHFRSIWGDFSAEVEVFDSTVEMKSADHVIIACKSLPEIDLIHLVEPVVRKDSVIIVLQNGINQEEKLREYFPHHVIIGALAFTCINRKSADEVEHLDYGHVKMAAQNSRDAEVCRAISDAWQAAGIRCEWGDNLRLFRWQKLLWNIPFNPLSVICRADSSEIIRDPALRELSREIMDEVAATAAAEGIELSSENIREMLANTEKMKPYKTSMLLDFEAGKKMEIEAILGEPLRIAAALHVRTPRMESLHALLSFIARRGQANPA